MIGLLRFNPKVIANVSGYHMNSGNYSIAIRSIRSSWNDKAGFGLWGDLVYQINVDFDQRKKK